MKKEAITQSQAISVVAMYTMGSSIVLGMSAEAKQDAWMGAIAGFAAALPMLFVFARLMRRFPGKNLFEICTEAFGKVLGKIVVLLFAWYAFHVGFLVMREFSEYIQVRVFGDMPQTVTLLALAVLAIWICRRGTEALGRWTLITLPIMIFLFILFTAFLTKDMHASNLLPVGEHLDKVPTDAVNDFALPFAETIICLGLLNTAAREGEPAIPGKALLYGVLIGFAMLLSSLLRNTMALGAGAHDKWYPSYDATSLIIIGSFISRIENVVGVNLLVIIYAKVAVCLLVASKGLAHLLGEKDHRPYAAPLGLLMAAAACIVYKNTPEVFAFLNVFPYYSFPFEVLLPVILWIVAEIRFRAKEKTGNGGAEPAQAGGI